MKVCPKCKGNDITATIYGLICESGMKDLENELKEAEIAFKHAGGRGVELAEKIDELKAKLGYDLDNSHI